MTVEELMAQLQALLSAGRIEHNSPVWIEQELGMLQIHKIETAEMYWGQAAVVIPLSMRSAHT